MSHANRIPTFSPRQSEVFPPCSPSFCVAFLSLAAHPHHLYAALQYVLPSHGHTWASLTLLCLKCCRSDCHKSLLDLHNAFPSEQVIEIDNLMVRLNIATWAHRHGPLLFGGSFGCRDIKDIRELELFSKALKRRMWHTEPANSLGTAGAWGFHT